MTEALDSMVIDHPHGLHEGVANGWPDEFKSALEQIFAHRLRLGRLGGDSAAGGSMVLEWLAVDKAPDVGVKTSEFLFHGEERLGILNGRGDLQSVAHDTGIREQRFDFT